MKSKSIIVLFFILLIFCAGYHYYKKHNNDDVKLSASTQKETAIEEPQKGNAESITKEDVKEIVRNEINNDPEIVVKAIETHMKNQQQQEYEKSQKFIQDNKNAIISDNNDPVYGKPTAKNIIVDYYDYNCIHCKKMSHVIKKLVDEKQDVQIIFKELPILGMPSTKASTAALAVNKIAPSKYLDFHFALIEDDSTDSIDLKIKKVAKLVGISVEQLYKEMDNPEIKTILKNNLKLASNIGIRGIPALIINGQLYPSSMTYEQIISIIGNKENDKSASQDVAPDNNTDKNAINNKTDKQE